MARTKAKTGDEPDRPDYVLPDRELVVVAEPSARLRAGRGEVQAAPGTETAALNALLAEEGVALEPLFGASEERTRAAGEALSGIGGAEVPDLSIYYRVRAEDERLDELALSLAKLPGIAQAYVKPAAEPAVPQLEDEVLERRTSAAADTPPVTPDFTAGQGYLMAAPGGIDAVYAGTVAGGGGAGVDIIDIEGAWHFATRTSCRTRAASSAAPRRPTSAGATTAPRWSASSAATATRSASPGISPDAHGRAISIFGPLGSARGDPPGGRRARRRATSSSSSCTGRDRATTSRSATTSAATSPSSGGRTTSPRSSTPPRRGVIVVEAAGNGAEDLDDALYDTPAAGFPATWTNPFNRDNPSSGAIVVGAGAPPPGTHGHDHGPDRSRLDFSNYGARVDAQGWGREVTTTGYGDLQGGADEDVWYTARSAARPAPRRSWSVPRLRPGHPPGAPGRRC